MHNGLFLFSCLLPDSHLTLLHLGGKYVPPALRGQSAGPYDGSEDGPGSRQPARRVFYDRYNMLQWFMIHFCLFVLCRDEDWGSGGDGGRSRGYGYGPRDGGYRQEFRSGGGGGGGRYGGGGGGGGGRRDFYESSYRSGPRKNDLGFHGDMRPNPRVEEELFFKTESQTTGINFDKVSK